MNIIFKILIVCIILIVFFYLLSKIIIITYLRIIDNRVTKTVNKKLKKISNLKFNKLKYDLNDALFSNNTTNVKEKKEKVVKKVCLNHEECLKNKKKFCKYGRTNYIHPINLNPYDKKLYCKNIQHNFTLQDYVNWLHLHKDDIKDLSYQHANNLRKVLNDDCDINIPKNELNLKKIKDTSNVKSNISSYNKHNDYYSIQ